MIEKVLPNGEKVTCFPLSAPQLFMLGVSIQYGAGYPVNNIACGYYWKKPMDYDVMKESIYEAIDRCETMRLRFLPNDDENIKVVQYITPKTEIVIDTVDYSDIPVEEAHAKLLEIARGPVPMFGCELHKIMLVKLSDGSNGFFLKIQHLAMDAYSVKVFIQDIMEIYLSKTQGRAYPKPMRPYLPVLMKELAYFKSEKVIEDYKYWAMSLATTSEPIYTDFLLESRLKAQAAANPGQRYANIHGGSPKGDHILFNMTGEETADFMKMCEDNNISVQAALSTAIRTALSIFNDNEQDITMKMIVNRRATVAEKKSGGIRINFFPFRTIISPDTSFVDAVKQVETAQADMYRHCDLPFMKMLEARHEYMPKEALADSTYDSVGFSYQPLMIIPNVDEETAKSAESVWYGNGASMIPLYITARHRPADGGIQFVFDHKVTDPSPVYDLTVFYKKMYDTIVAATKNPEVLIGTILEDSAVTEEERNGRE